MAGKRRGRGEGSIEELPSGKWRAVLSHGIDSATGNRRKLQETFDTKKDALSWLRDRQSEQGQGRLATAGKMTVAEWMAKWLEEKRRTKENRTHGFYSEISAALIVPYLGEALLAKLSADDVESWHARLTADGYSSDRQRKAATTLRAALNAAVAKNPPLIPSNPAKKVAKPKQEHREMECWDAEQSRKFIAATAGYRLEAYYVLALDSGMRPSELLALQWPDVNWAARTVSVQRALEERNGKFRLKPPKSKAGTRTIRLTVRTMTALADHRKRMVEEEQDVERGTIFVTRAGGFQSQATIYRRSFLPILKKAGLAKVRPYILRHTSATLLLCKDVSVMAVSRRLGHEKIQTTLEHYGHVLPSMQERAVEVMEEVFRVDCPTVVPQDNQVA